MKNATPEPEHAAGGGGSEERAEEEGATRQESPHHPRHVPSGNPDDLANGSGNDETGPRGKDSEERFDAG